ncbi:hypothetical protein BH20ACT2_BH20ACT2_13740 [soil metagenome]
MVGLLAVGASACGDPGSTTAATVNGTEIPASDILDQIEAFVASGLPSARGEGEGTASSQLAADLLTNQIILELIAAEADERGLEITDDDRSTGLEQLYAQYAGAGPDSGQELVESLPADLRERLTELVATRVALSADLAPDAEVTDEVVRAAYEQDPEQFTRACLNFILVADRAAADAAEARIEGGERFATVAAEVSTDPSSVEGGSLGCVGRGQLAQGMFDEQLFAADDGDLLEPFEVEGGVALIQLTGIQVAEFADVREQLTAALEQTAAEQAGQALTEFLLEAIDEADVSVRRRFGQWDTVTGVTPPQGPRPEGPAIYTLAPGQPPPAPGPAPGPAPDAPPAPSG